MLVSVVELGGPLVIVADGGAVSFGGSVVGGGAVVGAGGGGTTSVIVQVNELAGPCVPARTARTEKRWRPEARPE